VLVPCARTSDCPDRYSCDVPSGRCSFDGCLNDDDCAGTPGALCELASGVCRIPGPSGVCDADSDCDADSHCEFATGFCAERRRCAWDLDCLDPLAERCALDGFCSPRDFCRSGLDCCVDDNGFPLADCRRADFLCFPPANAPALPGLALAESQCLEASTYCRDDLDCADFTRCDIISARCVRDGFCDANVQCGAGEACDLRFNGCVFPVQPCSDDTGCVFGEVCDANLLRCVGAAGRRRRRRRPLRSRRAPRGTVAARPAFSCPPFAELP
jgi:hypothetical protein